MTGPEFTSEQLYKNARGNSTALTVGTIAFFKEQHSPVEEWITYLGNQLATTWDKVKGQGVMAALEAAVLNVVATGGSLSSFSGDEYKAEAVLTNWPPADFLAFFGLAQEDFDPFYAIFNPIAASLDLNYTWYREGNQVTITFTGRSEKPL